MLDRSCLPPSPPPFLSCSFDHLSLVPGLNHWTGGFVLDNDESSPWKSLCSTDPHTWLEDRNPPPDPIPPPPPLHTPMAALVTLMTHSQSSLTRWAHPPIQDLTRWANMEVTQDLVRFSKALFWNLIGTPSLKGLTQEARRRSQKIASKSL